MNPSYTVLDRSLAERGLPDHTPRIDLDQTRIIGCTCGWATPAGTTDSDDAFAAHAAQEKIIIKKETSVTKKQGGGVFNGVKVISATMVAQRQVLGETITAWLEDARAEKPGFQLVEILVRQSSDEAFHCISCVIFFRECPPKNLATKVRSPEGQTARAGADIASKAKTPTNAPTATSNVASAEILPTSVSANASKTRQ